MDKIPIRLIVAGSREFNDYDHFKRIIDTYLAANMDRHITFISGCASRGPDDMIRYYARYNRDYPIVLMPADWDKHSKRAGYIRNTEMADFATQDGYEGRLLVFWNKESRGTRHMINIANEYGMTVDTHIF